MTPLTPQPEHAPASFKLTTVEVRISRPIGARDPGAGEFTEPVIIPIQEPTVHVTMSVYGLNDHDLLAAAHAGAEAALRAVEEAQAGYIRTIEESLADIPVRSDR